MMEKLVFVYSVGSGIVNGLLDYAHKTLSPHTYACKLCALTYGYTGMHAAWRRFVDSLNMPVEFLHRDELHAHYGVTEVQLPAAFAVRGKQPEIWLDAIAINACASLDELQVLVKARYAQDANVR